MESFDSDSFSLALESGPEHRGGLGTRLKRLRPDPGLIDRIGGREVLHRTVDGLYERIAEDPLLAPLFGGRVRGEHDGQKRFFEEWTGGEPRYRREGAGHGIYLLHYRFGVDRRSAGRWLRHLVSALRAEGVAEPVVKETARLLGPMAHALGHRDGPPLPAELRGLSNTAWIERLAERPDLLRAYPGEGRRMLFRAAEKGDRERVDWLAGAGVAVDRPFLRHGLMLTPWCAARSGGHVSTAQRLLDHGARIDIFSAAFLGDLGLMERLLDHRPDWVDVEDPAMDLRSIRPLHHAIGGRQPEAACLLLSRGARPGPDSASLLRTAADAGWSELVGDLLANGAEASDLGPGRWVLNQEIAQPLIDAGASVNRPAGAWLHFCTSRFGNVDDPRLVERLLDLGADLGAEEKGAGALHLAANAGHVETLRLLLGRGLDVDVQDANGETALAYVSWAVRSADRVSTAEVLIDHGASPDHRGSTGLSVRERFERVVGRDRDGLLALLSQDGKESEVLFRS